MENFGNKLFDKLLRIKRNFLKSFAILLFLLLIFSSEKDSDTASGIFKIGPQKYELTDGIISNYGRDNYTPKVWEGYWFSILLVSEGVSIGNNTYSGTGNYISISVYSPTSSPNGDYGHGDYLSSEDETVPLYTFEGSYGQINDGDPVSRIEMVEQGEVSIIKNGSEYEILIENCLDDSGKIISGKFKGNLMEF